jgi:tetratricopeptide (TPR) repeat protein
MPAYAGSFGIEELREFRHDHGIKSFIIPAHYFYFKGIEARRAGRPGEALEFFERSAEMDPAFPDPRFSLARELALHQPAAALSHFAAALTIIAREFRYQHLLGVNAALYVVYVLLIASVLVAAYLLVRGARHLAHVPYEMLRRKLGERTAALGSAIIAGAPLLAGAGFLPTLGFYLGWLRPQLTAAERRFAAVLLVVAALTGAVHAVFPRLIAPMDPAEPIYTAALAQDIGYSDRLEQRLAALSESHPDDGVLHFVRALNLKRGGHVDDAEAALAQAERALGPSAAVLVNQGNLAFTRGDDTAAEVKYLAALERNPRCVEAHFNLSQVFTRRFDFPRADLSLAQANALDFARVREMTRVAETRPALSVMDASLPPGVFWRETLSRGHGSGHAPELLMTFAPRGRLDLLFPATLVAWILGLLAARGAAALLSTTGCANCGRVVCRRCVRRMEGRAYCRRCGEALAGLRSPDYSALLLDRLIEREGRGFRIVTGIAAALFPGFAFVLARRLWPAFGLAAAAATLFVFTLHRGLIIDAYPVLFHQSDFATRAPVVILLTVALYAASLLGYLRSPGHEETAEEQRLAA